MLQSNSTIQIKIEAYGAVEKLLPANLVIYSPPHSDIGAALSQVITLYPEAKNLIERCACAVGEDIIPRHSIIEHAMTLVLLSPVAGG
ncbi:MoaD/ThiS family protein [Acinetobacter sp. ANC 4173]|uniref:MoaD/ThiS family protein n=1 Tax=Acinetobacter sp. ANC 4173 TaxID=2529837 RepID=UPI00103C95D8|nr:MoaD/ThiS family protein [Acinetobacter sp. ANC 4173]TCB79129.1 MoaD/ThiS family protein [Acinetobacter sp. ANC 4173]